MADAPPPSALAGPLDALLARTADLDGTDLYLTVGAPPLASVSKKMVPLLERVLSRADIERAIAPFLAVADRAERFAAKPEIDLAHAIPGKGRFRINIFRQRGEPALVARRVKLEIPTLEGQNLPPILGKMALERKGLILVTGATGCGKSTTLAAMIDYRNTKMAGHILTIEDPIEFVHEHKASLVSQREVGVDTMSFADALKSALRQAPDVLLVGEIRDRETAGTALELCETGHLVLATLHSTNAPQTLERLINLFPADLRPPMQMLLSLNLAGIVTQRLVPSKARGGRVAAFEILVPTLRLRHLVRDGSVDLIREAMTEGLATTEGMQTFDNYLHQLIRSRVLTLEEALPFAESANDLRIRVKTDGGVERPEGIRIK